VNAAGLCGRSDWRRPTLDELFSLADFHETPDGGYPGLDIQWFPDLPGLNSPAFWSSVGWADARATYPGQTWALRYGLPPVPLHQGRLEYGYLRLVRSAR
jgi:hypothetical protein